MPKLIVDVKKLIPLDQFVYWASEREKIRAKREALEKPPFTDDKILQAYRFCNVRRMDDKVSKWLLRSWYAKHMDHPNMLVGAALARFFNNPDSLAYITNLVFKDGPLALDAIKIEMRRLAKRGDKIWSSAYIVGGVEGKDKVESVIDNVRPLVNMKVDTSSMEDTWSQIKSCYGFGSFQAGQVVADLRWAMTGTWGDKLTWAPIGPGSARGMNRLHSRTIDFPLKQDQFLVELRELHKTLSKRLPAIMNRCELCDTQSICCEADKYLRMLNGEGRLKQLYKGG